MARVKVGPYTRRRRKRWLRLAKGYYGARSRLYQTARVAVMRALTSAYREKKRKKRDFRALFISRINAALKQHDLSYSKFIHGMKHADLALNRKSLSELAIRDPEGFDKVVEIAKSNMKKR